MIEPAWAMKDIYSDLEILEAVEGQSISTDTDTDGQTVDLLGYEACMFIVSVGDFTDGDFEVVLQHAEDDGNGSPDTWEDVPDDDLLGTETTLSEAAQFKVGYRGIRRFVRVRLTSTNVSTGATISATAVLGHGRRRPETTQTVT